MCDGSGAIIRNPCSACHGTGLRDETRTVEVTIPAGVSSGTNIRAAGMGFAGQRGGPSGHLFVHVQVDDHPVFKREGSDVHVTVPLTLGQAVLGGTVTVPTLDGESPMVVAAGTQPGTIRSLRGKGIKKLNQTSNGNLYVHLNVHIPTTLTPRQRSTMLEFTSDESVGGTIPRVDDSIFSADSNGGPVHPEKTPNEKGFFSRFFAAGN